MQRKRTKRLAAIICIVSTLTVMFCGSSWGSVPSLDANGESSTGSVWNELPEIPKDALAGDIITELYETTSGSSYLMVQPVLQEKTDVLCLMLLPETENILEFLEETEWDLTAAQDKITIAIIQADWDDTEEADRYYDEVYQDLADSQITESTEVFLTGYENAADFASREGLYHTTRYAGLVLFDGEGLPEELMTEYEKQMDEDHDLSVWMIAPKKTKLLNRNIAFWKTWNGIEDSDRTSYKSTFATELYLPRTSGLSDITDHNSRMGEVLFSRCSEYRDPSVCQDVSRNFFTCVHTDEVSFRESITGGELVRINDLHFSYHRKQMEGQQRDYWTYVPDSAVFGDEPASLILCLHGNGGCGEDMVFRSMWHNVAADNNCIVLYPSSLYKSGDQHYWMNIKEEMDFIRALVEETCQRFAIDRTHIYVTGFSNGAGMAQNLAVRCSDIFAAAALSAPVYFDEEYYIGPINEFNAVGILFSYGEEDEYLLEYHMTADINDIPAQRHLEYWRGLYGFQQRYYRKEEKGKFTVYTYGSINQLPVCQWITVDGKDHDYPEEETYIYYEFMKHFSKTEDGNLYYDGQLIKTRRQ